MIVIIFQDFESNPALKNMAIDFLEDIICSQPALLPSEHRASSQLLRMLTKEESDRARERVDLHNVLNMGQVRRSSILITEWPSRIIPIDGVSLLLCPFVARSRSFTTLIDANKK